MISASLTNKTTPQVKLDVTKDGLHTTVTWWTERTGLNVD